MLSNEKSREFIALVGAAAAPRAFAARRRHIAKDRQMLFRIGISLGDVMIEGDDILVASEKFKFAHIDGMRDNIAQALDRACPSA